MISNLSDAHHRHVARLRHGRGEKLYRPLRAQVRHGYKVLEFHECTAGGVVAIHDIRLPSIEGAITPPRQLDRLRVDASERGFHLCCEEARFAWTAGNERATDKNHIVKARVPTRVPQAESENLAKGRLGRHLNWHGDQHKEK